jgi:feruloyl esterase
MRNRFSTITVLVAAGFAGAAHAQTDSSPCEALVGLSLPETMIIAAEAIPAGPYTTPYTGSPQATTAQVPAFCRVAGVVEPAIHFELWLPEPRAWNNKFKAVGGGGFAGIISYPAMVQSIQAGYVTASTDTGHLAGEWDWLSDPAKLEDYGYRAIHEMTVKSKAIMEAYYGKAPEYSYFNGCSTGGRQGLMEAQRFPEDYDGIVSGAPVNQFVATHYTQLWVALAAKPTPDTLLTPDGLSVINKAVLAQCDAMDGVADGVLEDPRDCEFDPGTVQCSAEKTAECLSAEQVAALRKIYEGPRNPRTGEPLHPGLVPGGEAPPGFLHGWILAGAPDLAEIPQQYFSRSVFKDPGWNWRTFDFDKDVQLAAERTGQVLDATDPNLSKFRAGGGKLIVYHGWNDPAIFPEGSIRYYESAIATTKADDFFRLFMVPGMGHCRGGPGADQFDAQAALEAWVEQGVAPASMRASHREGGAATRTRLLCPYPQMAKYDGSGDTNSAESFVCSE